MKRTAFVIGAGASLDFGLPLGSQLVDGIRNQLTEELNHALGGPIMVGATNIRAADYGDAARDIAGALNVATSIDRLLDSRRDRPLVTVLGKAAIAHQIAAAERASFLGYPTRTWHDRQDVIQTARETWLSRLFALISNGVQPERASDLFADVAFITFNYDRCIEWYLWLVFQHAMGQPPEVAARLVQSIPIVHVYGQLGPLPQLASNRHDAVPFGADDGYVPFSAPNVRTFTEAVDSATQDKISEIIGAAEVVVCLGFAFDPLNVSVLFPRSLRVDQPLVGTALSVPRPLRNNLDQIAFAHGQSHAELYEVRAADLIISLELRERLDL